MSRTESTLRVKVRDLHVDDVLVPTGRIVTATPTRGARTPTRKHDVGVDGYRVTWGSDTVVTVERHTIGRVDPGHGADADEPTDADYRRAVDLAEAEAIEADQQERLTNPRDEIWW